MKILTLNEYNSEYSKELKKGDWVEVKIDWSSEISKGMVGQIVNTKPIIDDITNEKIYKLLVGIDNGKNKMIFPAPHSILIPINQNEVDKEYESDSESKDYGFKYVKLKK